MIVVIFIFSRAVFRYREHSNARTQKNIWGWRCWDDAFSYFPFPITYKYIFFFSMKNFLEISWRFESLTLYPLCTRLHTIIYCTSDTPGRRRSRSLPRRRQTRLGRWQIITAAGSRAVRLPRVQQCSRANICFTSKRQKSTTTHPNAAWQTHFYTRRAARPLVDTRDPRTRRRGCNTIRYYKRYWRERLPPVVPSRTQCRHRLTHSLTRSNEIWCIQGVSYNRGGSLGLSRLQRRRIRNCITIIVNAFLNIPREGLGNRTSKSWSLYDSSSSILLKLFGNNYYDKIDDFTESKMQTVSPRRSRLVWYYSSLLMFARLTTNVK